MNVLVPNQGQWVHLERTSISLVPDTCMCTPPDPSKLVEEKYVKRVDDHENASLSWMPRMENKRSCRKLC